MATQTIVVKWESGANGYAVVRAYDCTLDEYERWRTQAPGWKSIGCSRWVRFGPDGSIDRMGEGDLRPTDAELAAWKSEAPARLAHLNRPSGLPEDIYIRWGRAPRGGRSRNYATGEMEAGISAYAAEWNPETRELEFAEDGTIGGTALSYVLAGRRDVYLLTGREIGRGSDGEPLLSDIKTIGHLCYTGTGFVLDGRSAR